MKKNQLYILLFLICGLFSGSLSAQNPHMYISASTNNSVVEGNTVSMHINLSGAITTQVDVNITTITGTAGSSDFTALTTTVSIPAGQVSSADFSVATTNDALIEPDENFKVRAVAVSGNTSNAIAETTITITDNDTIPTVTAIANTTATEGGYTQAVYYSLSKVYNANVVINCVSATGTAGASDFTAVNSNVTIPAGQISAFKTFTITDDALVEPDETFVLNATVTSGNTTNSALSTTVTIIDNDTTPTTSIYGTRVAEGQTATPFVVLDRAYNSNVVVNFTTATGTAGTSDYTTTNITQTILAGNFTASVSIPTNNDTIDEPLETFYVNANVTSGNTTNTSLTSAIEIQDNDGLPDFTVYNFNDGSTQGQAGQVYEGDIASFYLSLSEPSTSDVIVHVVTSPGTASNTDFTPLNTTVTIPAGEYGISVPVQTTLDNLVEGTENFNFTATVTSGNTFNSSDSVVADIFDNYNVKAYPDDFTFVAGTGSNLSVIANDLFHGAPVSASNISISIGTNTIGAIINAQGILVIPPSTPEGYYSLNYTICETANPGICDISTINLNITSPLNLTYTSTYADSNGDGYVSAGDVLNIAFTFSNIGNAPITNIQAANYYNNITYAGGPIASLAPGASDSTNITGQIIITQEDINYGETAFNPEFDAVYHSNTIGAGIDSGIQINASEGIRLVAFIDSNNNGIQDGIEPAFRYGNFDYTFNGGAVHNIYCSSSYYLYESNPTTIYHLSYNVDTPYATYNLCPTTYSNVTIALGSGITTYYFPIATTPYKESSVYLIPWVNPPRPGVVWQNYISYSNNSNQPLASGTVTFTKDPQVTITNISQTGATTNTNGFTFNFTNLAPYETRYMNVELLVPPIPTVTLGQLLSNSVSINVPSGDIYPYNNTSSLTDAIVGSFDPNDITESHGRKILYSSFTSNDYLTYTIRFENTGTADAINIKIQDILDNKLDPATIRMIDSSYPYTLERLGTNLTWKLNGIDLPSSVAGTKIGKGYITFQIKPRPGYAVGDVIPNTASIYFDTNPAIVTNTFNTEFVNSLKNESFVFGNFSYYPNPVKNILTIANDSVIDEVSIVSVLGQQVFNKKVNDLHTEIDMNTLQNGVYFVKISSEGLEKTVKVVKE